MTSNKLLSVSSLKKSFGGLQAVNVDSLEFSENEITSLIGPNGAGKTTFLSILAGTVTKTEGKINVWGFDLDQNPRQVRASIGIVPQEVNLDAFFSLHQCCSMSYLDPV